MPPSRLPFAALLLTAVSSPLHAADDELRPPADAPAAQPTRASSADVARALAAGDADTALRAARALLSDPDARLAAAAALVAGRLTRERGDLDASVTAFAHARALGGPLAPWATWFEADTLLEDGRPEDARRTCERYRVAWPDGPHAEGCEELTAFALAQEGRASEALAAAARWDARHGVEAIGEQVELLVALGEAALQPDQAVRRLQRLTHTFALPGTGERAEAALAALRRQGIASAVPPTDPASLRARASSLREARQLDEAWSLYWSLAADPEADAATLAWAEAELVPFAYATRRFDLLAAWWAERTAEHPDDASMAFEHYRTLERAGDYDAATTLGLAGLAHWGSGGDWAASKERIARSALLARRYREARTVLDGLASSRGTTGERARFFGAFAAVQAGDVADAKARIERGLGEGSLPSAYRYWRAALLDGRDDAAADADRAVILSSDPTSWYAVLLRSQACGEHGDDASVRAGTMPATLPQAVLPGLAPPWSLPSPRPFGELPPSRYHADADASAAFEELVQRYGEAFPELSAVQDLLRVGLVELAGPLFARVVDDWRARLKRRDPVARDWATRFDRDRMRLLYQHTRDFSDLTRIAYGLSVGLDATEQPAVAALGLPLAQGRAVWSAARNYDVDPLLVLGLMRTESMYDADAVSPVGARGPMQIMPRTGHLLAHRVGDDDFHPGRLHDPALAIDFGVHYLGLLLDRFDGGWPLAVAAYNGGPHNVSHWLTAMGPDVPMDVFVESIPWKETRRYVRTVTERYAEYVAVYAPGGHVHVPSTPGRNDPTVVDF